MRSVPASGVQVAISPCTNLQVGNRSRALRNMSGDESSPTTCACGKRSTRSSVELPGPQPRSTTRRGFASGTCASRSRGGRVRWSSNFRYCRALQSSIASLYFEIADTIRLFLYVLAGGGVDVFAASAAYDAWFDVDRELCCRGHGQKQPTDTLRSF